MKRLFLPEILDMIANLPTFEERVRLMHEQNSPALKYLCDYAFNPNYKFEVEIPVVPKNHFPIGMGDLNLFAEMRALYVYTTFSKANIKRRKDLLASKLTFLSEPESKLVIDIITGKIKEYQNFTPELVKAVYPDLNVIVPEKKQVEEELKEGYILNTPLDKEIVAEITPKIKKPVKPRGVGGKFIKTKKG